MTTEWLRLIRPSKPIFIIGPPRSASSLMARALQRIGIPGFAEGHVFPLLSIIFDQANIYYRSMSAMRLDHDVGITNLPRNVLLSRIADIFEELHRERFQSDFWYDKTVNVEMIKACELMLELWPQARFIFCTRHGVELVMSSLRQFKDQTDFESACQQWARCHSAWSNIARWFVGKSYELRHELLLSDPVKVGEELGDVLKLDDNQRADLQTFFRSEIAGFLRKQRSGKHGADSAVLFAGLSEDRRNKFLEICGTEMVRYKYWTDDHLAKVMSEDDRVLLDRVEGWKAEVNQPDYVEMVPGGIRLHPPPPGDQSVLFFQNVRLGKSRRFRSEIAIENNQARCNVIFGVRIITRSKCIGERSMSITPGERRCVELEFTTKRSKIDVELSTKMAPGEENNYFSWATWLGPCLV